MTKYATVAACVLALVACRRSETVSTGATTVRPPTTQPTDARNAKLNEVVNPVPPQFLDRALLGSDLGPDGSVAKDGDHFPANRPVYLTMWFFQSPGGLEASAVWTTADKHPVGTARRAMNGAKVVTFALGSLKPGRYKVTGYWGGNIAVERSFEVVAAK